MSGKWRPRSQSLVPVLRKPTTAALILIAIAVSCIMLFGLSSENPPVDLDIPPTSVIKREAEKRPTPDFRILIGIMSPYWATARRQIVRNAYARFPKSLPVDIIFVEANLTAPLNQGRVRYAQQKAIEWENATYGDIMHLDCIENMNQGKTYEFLKKVGQEFAGKYTHVMKTDDDAFVNLPALVEVIKSQEKQEHLYWGTTYRTKDDVTWGRVDSKGRTELWGSGYVLGMDVVEWIATSDVPKRNLKGLPEDWEVFSWLMLAKMDDNYVKNRSAFSEYPYPELADVEYRLWNPIQPFGRWILVTHPLKYEWMFIETSEYYLSLEW